MNPNGSLSRRRSPGVALVAAAAIASAAGAGAWLGLRLHREQPHPRWNVVVVMADTLRADHLGAYGYRRDTSPWFDAFASEQAVLFEETSSQASCTFPSVNSFLTSRDPLQFVGENRRFLGIPDALPTLASILRSAGYDTAAVSASPIVRNTPSHNNPDGGFGAGFQHFRENCAWRSAPCVTHGAIRSLDELAPPFFLYLHYMDAHGPYRPPIDPGERRFAKREPAREFLRIGRPDDIAAALYRGAEMPELDAEDIQHLVDLYDDGILFMDGWWARLEDALRDRGLWESSIVVILADHGEEFLEAGDIGHCRTLSRRVLHTPLAIRFPGGPSGARVSRLVRNLDVVPTILDLLGIEVQGVTLEGESLLPLLRDRSEPPPVAPSFAWQAHQQSVRDATHKLVVDLRNEEATLYAIEGGLEIPVEEEAARDRLQRMLWNRNRANQRSREERVRDGEAILERLRALGYLQ